MELWVNNIQDHESEQVNSIKPTAKFNQFFEF